ncbi:hypothetical protein BGZ72_003708 [Mortierella alpina]|nr:hypothetical protein BGZ72_003708 [Mortierella alpina]
MASADEILSIIAAILFFLLFCQFLARYIRSRWRIYVLTIVFCLIRVAGYSIRASGESDAVQKGSSLWVSLYISEAVLLAIGMAYILVLLAQLYRSILPKVRVPSTAELEHHPDLFERTLVNYIRLILLPILTCTITGSILNTRRSSPAHRTIGAILHQIGVCLLAVCGAIFMAYAVVYFRRYWNHRRSFRQLLIVTILLEISLIYKVVCSFVDAALKNTAAFFVFSPLMELTALCLLSVDLQDYFLAYPHANTADHLEEEEAYS